MAGVPSKGKPKKGFIADQTAGIKAKQAEWEQGQQ